MRRPRSSNLPSTLAARMAGVVLGAVVVTSAWQAPAGTIGEPWIDTSNREAVAVAYAAEYADDPPAMAWTGHYDRCEPGTSSAELRQATVRRVNFYRAMAGVPTGVVEDEEYSRQAHHAALAMSAEGRLSHDPGPGFACLSGDGDEAAANSNLYLGRTGPAAVDGYIEDPGWSNRDVGHRNTILHPPTRRIGVGHVAGDRSRYPANALWVFDDHVFDDPPELREPDGFVAWPPRGHVPEALVYPRWSFSLLGADFDRATVTMTAGDRTVPLTVVTRHSLQGYVPAPIIVWEPDLGAVPSPPGPGGDGADPAGPGDDAAYRVVVDGVEVGGATRRFEYEVVVMADHAPGPLLAVAGPPGQLAYRAARTVGHEVVARLAELVGP